MWDNMQNACRTSCGKERIFISPARGRTCVLKVENESFSRKMQCLGQKQKKKTLAFYVNKPYTKKRSGGKWGKIPVNEGEVGER